MDNFTQKPLLHRGSRPLATALWERLHSTNIMFSLMRRGLTSAVFVCVADVRRTVAGSTMTTSHPQKKTTFNLTGTGSHASFQGWRQHPTHRFSSPSDGLGSCSLGTCSIHLNSIQQPIMRDWGKPHPRMHTCHSPVGRGQSVKHDRVPVPEGFFRKGGGVSWRRRPPVRLVAVWLGVKMVEVSLG